ncbi:MAG: hypothetical protein JWQ09_486 [Segetibacter sp.]|nr:hypothetical protein [Segetibacter sp.]
MKKNLLFLLLIASLISFSCKKSSDSPSAGPTSQWTFDGKTYKVTDASYDYGYSTLEASDDAGVAGGGNFVKVTFGSVTKPTASATLTVVEAGTSSNPTNCEIQVGNIYDASRPLAYLSTGKSGDKVNLTVSSDGKLTVSFSNITVFDHGSTTKTVTGTIIEP